MIVKLKLFFKWGIVFGKDYTVADKGNRKVEYAGKNELLDEIVKKYPAEKKKEPKPEDDPLPGAPDSEDIPAGGGQTQYQSNTPPTAQRTPLHNQERSNFQ